MKIIKTTLVSVALTLISTSAFAGNQDDTSTAKTTRTTHVAQPAVLIDANPYASKTTQRRIVSVVKKPVETPVARDASMTTGSQFVFKYGKNTNTKTFRPAKPKSESMPNLHKK